MSLIERRGIRCTYGDGGLIPGGRPAYVLDPNAIDGAGRVEVVVSEAGSSVRRWTELKRLSNFHWETVPSGHPQHDYLPTTLNDSHRSILERRRQQRIPSLDL